MLGPLMAFAGICLLEALTPGLDTALVVRNVVKRGRRAGLLAALGTATGLYIHATAVALGVATLLEHSVAAFTVLKLCGTVFLAILGLRALWTSFARHGAGVDVQTVHAPDHVDVPRWLRAVYPDHPFMQGLLSDVTNPKAILFFLTFLLQFLTPGQARLPFALALATIDAGIDLIWLSCYVLVLGRLAPLLQRPPVQRVLDGVTGALFIAFGIRLAVESQI